MQAQPQGIAALGRNIPQPPMQPQMQAPQMPMGGMGPSRAGLGTVQDRVDAYRSNPQALQQQYAVSQDMLDLLALQQIKSEKDAAMRQMQLQMAQQSPQQPTVKDQLEGQVMEMTKQDLAKQTGMVGQQQEQQKQQAMQQLMSGIARAPGAANVMPARMAGGGIIAFQNRGEVPDDWKEALMRRGVPASYIAELQARGFDRATIEMNARMDYPEVAQTAAVPMPSVMPGMDKRMDVRPSAVTARPEVPSDTPGVNREAWMAKAGLEKNIDRPAAIPQTPVQETPAMQTGIAGVGIRAPQMPSAPESPMLSALGDRFKEREVAGPGVRLPQAQPAPQGQPESALGGRFQAPGIAGLSREQYGQRLQDINLRRLTEDPAAAEVARRKEAEEYMREALAKQRGVKEQGIEALRASMAERFDPELQRRENIKQFLLSARGRGFGDVMGSAARGSISYQQQQAEQQRASQAALQKMQEDLAGIDVTQRGKYFDVGAAERKAIQEQQAEAGRSGAGLFGTMTQAEVEAANRASLERRAAEDNVSSEKVARINAAAQNRPGETERIYNTYVSLLKTDPKKAEEYLQTIERISGRGKGLDIRETNVALKALKDEETQLLKQLESTFIPKERDAIRKRLDELNERRLKLMQGEAAGGAAGAGGAAAPTNRLKFDAKGNLIQ